MNNNKWFNELVNNLNTIENNKQFYKYYECNIELIETEYSKESWIFWINEEFLRVRERFGSDEEAIEFWPDDYYQKMENWWKSSNRYIDPINCLYQNKKIEIIDGWHRFALSYKLNIIYIPIVIIN